MGKRFIVTEEEKNRIHKMYLSEEPKNEERRFCNSGNVKSLEEIVGDAEASPYVKGVAIRQNGVNGLVDMLELLKFSRLVDNISDGGEHLASQVMNQLKGYKPYNYFDETRKECNRAMDKIIELYKENEHGEELVQDIEKVYGMSHHSPRAKEYLKHSLEMLRGK